MAFASRASGPYLPELVQVLEQHGELHLEAQTKERLLAKPHGLGTTKPGTMLSDNGVEFINAHLLRYCQDEQLTFTRSRPYKKNDLPCRRAFSRPPLESGGRFVA